MRRCRASKSSSVTTTWGSPCDMRCGWTLRLSVPSAWIVMPAGGFSQRTFRSFLAALILSCAELSRFPMLSASVTVSVNSSDTRTTNGLVTEAFSPFHSVPWARLRMLPASFATLFSSTAMAAQSSAADCKAERLAWKSSSKVGISPLPFPASPPSISEGFRSASESLIPTLTSRHMTGPSAFGTRGASDSEVDDGTSRYSEILETCISAATNWSSCFDDFTE